jgi:outer membrane lipoprotein-sorting protein
MRRTILVLAGVVAWAVAGAFAQDTIDSVEAKVREAWAKNQSISANVAIEANVPLGQTRMLLSGGGTMNYLKGGDKEMYRQTISAKLPDPMTIEVKADVLFDGADLYLTTELFGKQKSEKATPDLLKGAVPPGGGMLFDVLKKELNLALKPEAPLDGKAMYVIEATPKNAVDPEVPFGSATLYLDKESGMLTKVEINEPSGTRLAGITYTGIKLNPEIPASLFVYVPPAPPQPAAPAAAPATPAKPAEETKPAAAPAAPAAPAK